jgi:formate--tetrahydrofolate ligase
MSTFPSDIEIAQNATMSHIKDIAKKNQYFRR